MPKSSDTTGDGSSEEEGPGYRWLGTTAAADLLGVVPRTLYRLIDEGLLPAYKMGLPAFHEGSQLYFRAHEIDDFINSSRIVSPRRTGRALTRSEGTHAH